MQSFSRRLTRRIVIALILTLALVIIGILYQFSWVMGFMTNAYYGHVADIENESVEKRLHDIQVAIHNSIDEMERQLSSPDSICKALKDKLQLNPNLAVGFGAAFEPNFYPEEGPWFEPYAMWKDGEIEVRQIGSATHDYFSSDWYRKGIASEHGSWSEPYFDETGASMLLCTYAVPIRDKNRVRVGILGGDISLDYLHNYLKQKDLKTNTEGPIKVDQKYEGDKNQWVSSFIIGREGYYISHPNKERILRDNFFDDVSQKTDTVAKRMISDMKAGRKGSAKTVIDGVPATIFYTPLEHTGWVLSVILPEKRLQSVIITNCLYLLAILLLGLLAIYVICRITIHRSTRPLYSLAKSADEVAKGNFNTPLPVIYHDDEIRHLRDSFGNMQQSLSLYIKELQDTTAQKSAIESELAIARNIQMSMLPKADSAHPLPLDIYASLTPAKAVGGDLYDYFLQDGRLYFCIGDVSGKGVPAALVMATARSAFRLLAESESEPVRIVSRMNETLARDNDLNFFITFFVGVLDLATGRLQYCNAGHKAPYVNGKPLPLERHLPVGAISDWPYTGKEIVLAPDTTLFLYTDGLNEAENAQQQMFGKERIKEILQSSSSDPRTLIERMTQAVADFVGDTEQSDDLTMLALHWKKSSSMFNR